MNTYISGRFPHDWNKIPVARCVCHLRCINLKTKSLSTSQEQYKFLHQLPADYQKLVRIYENID